MIVTVEYLIGCGVDPVVAARRCPGIVVSCGRFGIHTRKQVAAYVGETMHESRKFTKMEEDMNYSAPRLQAVWPRRFPTLALAELYAHAPQKLANFVYGAVDNKLGNIHGSEDGWDFRGSGDIQTTGRANFTALSNGVGTDYIKMPSLLRTVPTDASIAGGWFWFSNGCNTLIEATGNIDLVSKKINPGAQQSELLTRAQLYAKCYALAND